MIVSTPDHMHAPIALPAMQLGKHVFCQKPLTHTVFEARQMRRAAEKYGVVTQMGNQIQSHEAYRTAVKLVHDGVDRQGEGGPLLAERARWAGCSSTTGPPAPTRSRETLHWDDWLGVAPARPYKEQIYHPFNWRAWQDFSNGQLGDFGCHILDPVFLALGLTAPTHGPGRGAADQPRGVDKSVHGRTTSSPAPSTPPARRCKLTWYDGEGHFPPREALGLPEGYKLPGSGSVLRGREGLAADPARRACRKLFPEEKFADFKIEAVPAIDHYVAWADACRGEGKTTSHFDYAGPLTETVLLGTIAIRIPGETLRWDAADLKITGSAAANALLTKAYRKGWEPSWGV